MIPLWLKLAYTAFVAVLVPIYLRDYGPTNFLYFCDVALLMTLVAIWTESSLWASAPLVGIFVPQLLWQIDFLAAAVGIKLTGLTGYMFDQHKPFITRFLSFFHFWLPILLFYLVWRLRYDRRGWLTWSSLGLGLLFVCYFLMPGPPPPLDDPNLPVNINYVYGMSDSGPQTRMDPNGWFALECVILVFAIWWPTHVLLAKLFPRRTATPPSKASEPAPAVSPTS